MEREADGSLSKTAYPNSTSPGSQAEKNTCPGTERTRMILCEGCNCLKNPSQRDRLIFSLISIIQSCRVFFPPIWSRAGIRRDASRPSVTPIFSLVWRHSHRSLFWMVKSHLPVKDRLFLNGCLKDPSACLTLRDECLLLPDGCQDFTSSRAMRRGAYSLRK